MTDTFGELRQRIAAAKARGDVRLEQDARHELHQLVLWHATLTRETKLLRDSFGPAFNLPGRLWPGIRALEAELQNVIGPDGKPLACPPLETLKTYLQHIEDARVQLVATQAQLDSMGMP